MAKVKANVAAIKIKKKAWYSIMAPEAFNGIKIGETYVADAQSAINRIVQVNLKEITDNVKDQSVYLKFRITGVANNTFSTEPVGQYMMPATVKKLTRRTASRMDESFVVVTSDGKRVRIKPVLITVHRTIGSICAALRKACASFVAREAAKVTFLDLMRNIIMRKLQNDVKKKISKIYPIKVCEIKALEFAREGKAVAATPEPEEPVKEETAEQQAEHPSETQEETPKRAARKKKTVTEEMTEEIASPAAAVEAEEEESESFGEEEKA